MLSTKRQPHPHSHLDTPKYRAGKTSSRPKRPTPPISKRIERRQKPDSPPDGKSVPQTQSITPLANQPNNQIHNPNRRNTKRRPITAPLRRPRICPLRFPLLRSLLPRPVWFKRLRKTYLPPR